MAARSEGERVKLCLACDRLIPFPVRTCPHCGKDQPVEGRMNCPVCSASIPNRSLFCPDCGRPAVPCAFMPGRERVMEGGEEAAGAERVLEGWSRVSVAAGLILEAWVVLEVTGIW